MTENEIMRKLINFKRDFQLTSEEVNLIAKVGTSGFEKRARRMDKIRREMKGVVKPEAMRKWLFTRNRILRDSYYNLMVKGHFDKVIEDIIALKEGVYV